VSDRRLVPDAWTFPPPHLHPIAIIVKPILLTPTAALAALPLLFATGAAQAQIVDEVDIRREGADAVVSVRFATEVQFQRAVSTRSGDLTQIAYNLLTVTNTRLGTPVQVRKLRADKGLPEIEVADEADRSDRGDQARRLVLRFGAPVTTRVRAGRDNRSIDIVIVGKGGGLPSTSARTTRPARPADTPAAPKAGSPAPAPAPATAAAPPSAAPATSPAGAAPMQGTPELEAKASDLLARAKAADTAGRIGEAVDLLNQLLELPPTSATQEAQELVGRVHLRTGDAARARAEFETYLQLFPTGEGADRVRRELPHCPPRPAPVAWRSRRPPTVETEVSTITGSTSMTYYGGNGQVRSRDFQDSPIAGLPQVAGDPQLSSDRSATAVQRRRPELAPPQCRGRPALRLPRLVHHRPGPLGQEQEPPDRAVLRPQVADRPLGRAARPAVAHRRRRDEPLRRPQRPLERAAARQARRRGRCADRQVLRFEAPLLRCLARCRPAARAGSERGVYAIEQRIDGEIDRRASAWTCAGSRAAPRCSRSSTTTC
jgi:hypothetical protein